LSWIRTALVDSVVFGLGGFVDDVRGEVIVIDTHGVMSFYRRERGRLVTDQ